LTDLAPFVAATVAGRPASVALRGEAVFAAEVRAELADLLARHTDPDWCRAFAAACPVRGVDPLEYALRVLDLGPLGHALAGIHFRGGETRFPFVHVYATSQVWEGMDLAFAALELGRDFAAFEPKAVRVVRDAGAEAPLDHAGIDQTVHAATLGTVRSRGPEPLTLTLVDDLGGAVAFLSEVYDAVFAERPELLGRMAPATLPMLEQCADTGVVSWAWLDGRRVGLAAVASERGWGLDGYAMFEEVLVRDVRGRGLGARLQHGVAHLLVGDDDALLWGTIDDANAASRRTAERAGRDHVATLWWLPLGG
jgi:hypothetical protein